MQLRSATSSYSPSSTKSILKIQNSEAVKVIVRCRPLSQKEQSQGHSQIIDMWPERGIVHITNPRKPNGRSGKMFTFDSVYDWKANQDDLYENSVKHLVHSVLDGYNGTIFAYGQTGTGKTYTMLGSRCNPKEKGITSKCFEDIFRHIAYASDHTSFVVRASYLEIYQEETRDLLSPNVCKKPLREDVVRGVYVKGLQSVVCKNIKAIERVMRIGNMNRATAATNMNEHSSRSHAIFQVTIEMHDKDRALAARRYGAGAGSGAGLRVGKLNLVDLAGSERQCKTGAVGERLKESGKINLSLSALGNVISALVDGKGKGKGKGSHRHIPYRDSKLTQLLQDSLGGNSKAIMIANIGPASYNYDESLMTLRYASRAKRIKNKPTRNENNSVDALMSNYNEQMRALQNLIAGSATGSPHLRDGERAVENGSSSSTEDSQAYPSTRTRTRTSTSTSSDVESTRRLSARALYRCSCRMRFDRRSRRPHRSQRIVWKLNGKYHQETTVKMVRWIQEQIHSHRSSNEEESKEGEDEEEVPEAPVAPKQFPAEKLTDAELGVHKLVDDLSDAVLKETVLLSMAQLSEERARRALTARVYLKMAAEMRELRQRAQGQNRRQRVALRSEQARLRKAVALKQTVLRAYVADRDCVRPGSCCSSPGTSPSPSPNPASSAPQLQLHVQSLSVSDPCMRAPRAVAT